MMQKIPCICCPFGCSLYINQLEQEYQIQGNKCPRGKKYAIEEMTASKRVITSTIKISDGTHSMIPVKTDKPVAKEKMFTIMDILAKISVQAPINISDIIIENVADTNANIIATKEILRK